MVLQMLWEVWAAVEVGCYEISRSTNTSPCATLPLFTLQSCSRKSLAAVDATGVVLSAALLDHWTPIHPTHAAATCGGKACVVHARCMWGIKVLGSSLPEACHSETSILSPSACLGKELLPWKNPFWSAWSEAWQQSWSEEPAFPLALSSTAETLQCSLQWAELVAPKKRGK